MDLGPQRLKTGTAATLVGLATAALLLATSFSLPMVWDEGDAILRAEGIARWCQRWSPDPHAADPVGPFSQRAIAQDWVYATQREGHPALYGIVIASGKAVSEGWLPPLQANRFGPIVLFAVAAGAMFYRMARQFSLVAAVGAVGALLLLPRMFAHAHFASFDGPLTSSWILAWATFAPACRNWRWAILWGIALGMTFSCKATGWLAPLPFLVWAAWFRDRHAGRAILVGLPVALVVFFLLNPPLWHHPLQAAGQFFALNLNRRGQPGLNISTQFFGRLYNLDYPLPWYNTLVWTAITTPVGLLLLLGVGLWRTAREKPRDGAAILLILNWLILVVARALPGTPPHDGVRLFLPSFAFLAALVGLGAAAVWTGGTAPGAPARPSAGRVPRVSAIVLIYLGSLTSLVWYAPQWLSYYNLLMGGVRGATALGMEPTYYWDGLDRATLAWLDQHTRPGEKVVFAAAPEDNLALMAHWGFFHFEYRPDAPGRNRWYVLQRRPGAWQRADQWLIAHAIPAYSGPAPSQGWGPWQKITLVEVYDFEELRRFLK